MAGIIGQQLEIEFVESEHNGRKGLKSTTKVGGRYAFPDRRGQQPLDGDIWKAEVYGENTSGSVYFLRCISRVSTRAERKATQEAAREHQRKLDEERHEMIGQVSEALQAFAGWDATNPTISVGQYVLPIMVKLDSIEFTLEGIAHNYSAQANWEGQFVPNAQSKRTVVVPWSEVEVSDSIHGKIWTTDYDREAACNVKTARMSGMAICHPLSVNPDWGTFVEWRLVPNQVRAVIRVSLPMMGISQDLDILVGEFKDGKTRWTERWTSDWGRGYLIMRVPETGPEQIAHLEAAKAAYEQAGSENQQAGLLTVPSNVFHALRELGVAGIGWARYAGNPEDPEKSVDSCGVIHPTLVPLFEGAQDWNGPIKPFVPLVMRKGAPSDAWGKIEWPNGRLPNLEQVAEIRRETIEEAKLLDQETLGKWLREQQTLQAEIVAVAIHDPQYKYRFDAVVQYPHKVTLYLAKKLGFSRVLVSETQERRPHTVENIARGNEYFAGHTIVQAELVKAGRHDYKWTVTWTAPQTKQEETSRKVDAIRTLIQYGREYQTALSGWRYTDTGNPVVLVNYSNSWAIREYDRETYTISKRKGFGSDKGTIWSLSLSEIRKGLSEYGQYGWPVGPDPDWQEKAGKSILSLFPAELIARLEGGA